MKKLKIPLLIFIFILVSLYSIFYYSILPNENIIRVANCTHRGAWLSHVVGWHSKIPYSLRFLNFHMPFSSVLCDAHFKKYRGNPEDIAYLNSHDGAFHIATQNSRGGFGLLNYKKNVDNLRFLISKGLDVNAKPANSSFSTPLLRAVVGGKLEATQILLDHGADPNIKGSLGFTPLEIAIELKKSRAGKDYDSADDHSGIIGILKDAQEK